MKMTVKRLKCLVAEAVKLTDKDLATMIQESVMLSRRARRANYKDISQAIDTARSLLDKWLQEDEFLMNTASDNALDDLVGVADKLASARRELSRIGRIEGLANQDE